MLPLKDRRKICFDKNKYELALSNYPGVAKLVAPCDLTMLANLVRHSFPEFSKEAYKDIRLANRRLEIDLEQRIHVCQETAKNLRNTGQIEQAIDQESGETHYRKTLKEVRRESTKDLGRLDAKTLPFAPLYLELLERHIGAKTGRAPKPVEFARILEALTAGFDRRPEGGIDPDSLAKKQKGFRERCPLWVEDAIRKKQCDSLGMNELDRNPKLNKPRKQDLL